MVNTAACAILFFGIGILLLVTHRTSGFVESENRNVAEFPTFSLKSYFSGEFTSGIVNYYTDSIPARESLRAKANRFTELFGIQSDDIEIIGQGGENVRETLETDDTATTTKVTVYTGTRAPETTTSTSAAPAIVSGVSGEVSSAEPATTTAATTTTEAPVQTKQRSEVPDDGQIVNKSVIISGKGTSEVRAMPMFYGKFSMGKKYADVVNEYKKMVGDQVNVYNMSIPLSSAFYLPSNLTKQFSDQHDCIKNIGQSLENVINIDVFDTLQAHSNEYIYFRTDHHWQPLGAYYAAKEFAAAAAVPFPDLSEYEACEKGPFTGSMYSYSNYLEDLKKYPDTFYYYKPTNDYTIQYYTESFTNPQKSTLFFDFAKGANTYSTILGGDLKIPAIETDVKNGRTLVLIKNSYGNALVPFLVGSFEKIYVIDFRYVKVGMQDFFQRVGATDILFGMAIHSCHSAGHIDAIKEIMK